MVDHPKPCILGSHGISKDLYTEFLGFDLIIECKTSLEINYDDVEIQNYCSSTFSALMLMCFCLDHDLAYGHCM